MKTKILIGFSILIILAGGGVYYFGKTQKAVQPVPTSTTTPEAKKLDPLKEKTHLSKVGDTKGVYWVRAFDLTWNDVEFEKGKFDWSQTDEMIKDFNQREVYLVSTIKPFANWDQNSCHGGKLKVGKPCDLTAYSNFLEKAVERYDGDGQDDMPGLTLPIKYWEIMNEPEMQGGVTGGMGEELKFFVGTPEEYLDILKTSYQTIKKADQEAKVLPAGMAGMEENFQNFWRPILENEGGKYFDIANIHTISTDEKREDLFVIKFKKFLEKYGLSGKPIWLTEVQFGRLAEKPEDLKSFEILMVKGSVFALAQGADKLFYIENWLFWDRKEKSEKEIEKGKKEGKKKKLEIPPEILTSSTHKVYLNLVEKINQFEKIEKLKEEYQENQSDHEGATSKIGHYKFISNEKSVYVLWGKTKLPAEISGKLKVTDIYGNAKEIDAKNLVLTREPVFVEVLGPSAPATKKTDQKTTTPPSTTPPDTTPPETTPPATTPPTSQTNIKGSYDSTPIDNIENSLELVFTDSLNDYTNPGGGEPPGGVYAYPPIDTHQVYAGVRNGRLYIKWTLGGNVPSQREVIGDNIIKSVSYNLGVDIDGDLDDTGTIDGCYGSETHLQINFGYHDNGEIWINPWYQAKFIGVGEEGDGCQYEKTGGGLMHSSNGGLGKNYFVFSYSLSDLLNTISVGNDVHFDISSEAESNIYHHYSYDQNFNENRQPIWVFWNVKEI